MENSHAQKQLSFIEILLILIIIALAIGIGVVLFGDSSQEIPQNSQLEVGEVEIDLDDGEQEGTLEVR
ncbi:hypothetical protein COV82_04330 [Candidatus Peregrinibacteria bacterium CG11_big_fil_rev_8_21_14_0_20_46_8]|nr:MAG: hypothetical protein COV82_04330 [Candidatus Peregrinibacteria bacterium CG11_big_fil_rev_8_21_14_0_20_46_8]